MGKIYYIGNSLKKRPEARREPQPLFRALAWCGASILTIGAMMMVLITLGEIARRLTALSGTELSVVKEPVVEERR